MPEAFAEKDIQKPLYFGRMIQNTDYILKTPEGRAMATAQALGMDMAALFGGRKLPSPEQGRLETPPDNNPSAGEQPPDDPPPENNTAGLAAAAAEDPDFPDPTGTAQEETRFQRLTNSLQEFLDGYKAELDVTTKSGRNPYKMAQEELANPVATEETRSSMIARLRDYLKAKGIEA
jgi:hypothetical protein